MKSNHIAATLLTSLIALTSCTESETSRAEIPDLEITPPTQLSPNLQNSLQSKAQRTSSRIIRGFDNLAVNGDVSTEQIESLMQQKHAELRGQLIGAILSGDLDNSGDLNASELLALAMNGRGLNRYGRQSSLPLTQGDRNGDGVLSAEEIRRFASLFADLDKAIDSDPLLSLMAFDSNRDGILTRLELTKELEPYENAAMKTVPIRDLPAPAGSERQKAQQKIRDEACRSKLAVADNAEILLLSGYEGTALSTVSVTDGSRETDVAQVIIEPGDKPLYIIAGAYTDMIWSIEGDKDRVSGFVAVKSSKPLEAGAGVIGLPANKVDFIPKTCMKYFKAEKSQAAILAKSLFARIYERPVDHLVANYKLDSISLPSGNLLGKERRKRRRDAEKDTQLTRTSLANEVFYSAKDNHKAGLKTSLYRFSVDGIAYIDPKQVFAPSPLKTYEVYPAHAGLAQLVESGHLEKIDRRTYYIHKTFPYFPAGLGGSTSVNFILGKGVARPSGKPGHSSLIDEATGACLVNRCR